MKLKWIKQEHRAFAGLKAIGQENLISKDQWIVDCFSIIGPCGATFNNYELFDGKEVYRFGTLEEAQEYAEKIYNPKPIPIES